MKTKDILKIVYNNKKYYYLTIITLIISFIIFYKLTTILSGNNYTYLTLLTFLVISLLFGIYLSVVVYKFQLKKSAIKNKKGFMGLIGFIGPLAGVLGVGCVTCGPVILTFIGAPLALTYLPYHGVELRILAIAILLVSIYIISQSLVKCGIKK